MSSYPPAGPPARPTPPLQDSSTFHSQSDSPYVHTPFLDILKETYDPTIQSSPWIPIPTTTPSTFKDRRSISSSRSPVSSYSSSFSDKSSSTHSSSTEGLMDYGFSNSQFEVVSNRQLRNSQQFDSMFTGKSSTLIVLGNMVHGDDRSLLYEFMEKVTSVYQRIYYILGELEFTSAVYTMAEIIHYMKYLASLYDPKHVTILNNTTLVDHAHKLVVFGSPFWSHVDDPYSKPDSVPMMRVTRNTPLVPIRQNILHYKSVQEYEKAVAVATKYTYSLMVLTSYTPNKLKHKNGQYIKSDWDYYMNVPCLWVWVMGGQPIIQHVLPDHLT